MKKCKECKEYACIKRSENGNCFFEEMGDYAENEEEKLYWKHFRAEAAKDILCSIIQSGYYGKDRINIQSGLAVEYAEELVKRLKEKEEK